MICWIFFRCYGVSEPPAASPARLHKPAGRRRRNKHSAAGGAKGLDIMIYNLQCFFNPPPSNSAFLRRRPALTRGAGAPCLVSRLRQPCGLPPQLREPPLASPFAALGALWSPREAANPQGGFAFNVCSRTLIINPDVSTEAGCPIVAARFIAREKRFIAREKRFIARTLLSRQGWERLCAGGIASSIKLSHQVLFFLPITALTILAIATAMPSDCRLCSRQK